MAALRTGDADALGAALHNDLQEAACSLRPELRQTLETGEAGRGARRPGVRQRAERRVPGPQPGARARHRGRPQRDRAPAARCAGRTARSPAPGWSGTAELARNLVNLEGVGKAYGTRALLDGVSLGVAEGDRIGVVGRNGDGKSTLLRLLTRREPPDTGRVTHAGGLRVARSGSATTSTRRRPCARSSSATGRRTSGPPTPRAATCSPGFRRPGRPRRDARPGRRAAVRRRAAPGRAGPGAGRRARPAGARRADQPSRRRGHRLARAPSVGPARGARGRDARPLVPRRGLRPHLGGAGRGGPRVRRRLLGVRARPGRARPDAGGDRGPPRQPGAQGARLAAPRPAGPHVEAAVPDRRGQRAHRRRAAAARRRRAGAVRQRPARPDGVRRRWTPPCEVGEPDAARAPHLAGRARATGSASPASTARARPRCCGCWSAS